MDGSSECIVCLRETRLTLPQHLEGRLQSTLVVEEPTESEGDISICKKCMLMLEKIEELVAQLREIHQTRKECRSVHRRRRRLANSKTGTENQSYEEEICQNEDSPSKKISSSNASSNHKQVNKVHKCGCGSLFASFTSLTRHSTLVHGKRWVCPEKHCYKSYDTQHNLNAHKTTHNKMGCLLLQPVVTDEPVKAVAVLESELDNVPETDTDETMDHSYNQKINYEQDEERLKIKTDKDVDMVPEFPCPICDNIYHRESHLKKHVELSHWYKDGETLICINCDQIFDSQENMLPHAREHRSEMLKCPDCVQVFQNKPHLLRHRALLHNDKDDTTEIIIKCGQCSLTFETLSLLSYHNLLNHARVTQLMVPRPMLGYQCGQCDTTFPSTKDLRSHVKTAHGPASAIHECEICFETFYDKASLDEHLKDCQVQEEEPAEQENTDYQLICPVCDSVYENVPQLEDHIKNLHWTENEETEDFLCSHCSLTLKQKRDMIEHARAHRVEMTACRRCPGSAFPNADQLNLHNLSVHSGGKNSTPSVYVCGICDKECATLHLLSFHMLTLHNQYLQVPVMDKYLFKCCRCDKSFSSNRALRAHIQSHHRQNLRQPTAPELPRKLYACPICGDDFEEGVVLDHHVSLCSGKRRPRRKKILKTVRTSIKRPTYLCSQCGATYKTTYSYNIHMLEHKGKSTIQCNKCERNFYTNAQLKNHMLSHTKPHKCEVCGSCFALKAHLKDHAAVHALDKADYQCEVCLRKFRWRYSLARHRSAEHGLGYKYKERVGRVACKLCSSNMCASGMRRHFKNVHQNVTFDRVHFKILADRDMDKPNQKPKKGNKNRGQIQGRESVVSMRNPAEPNQDGSNDLQDLNAVITMVDNDMDVGTISLHGGQDNNNSKTGNKKNSVVVIPNGEEKFVLPPETARTLVTMKGRAMGDPRIVQLINYNSNHQFISNDSTGVVNFEDAGEILLVESPVGLGDTSDMVLTQDEETEETPNTQNLQATKNVHLMFAPDMVSSEEVLSSEDVLTSREIISNDGVVTPVTEFPSQDIVTSREVLSSDDVIFTEEVLSADDIVITEEVPRADDIVPGSMALTEQVEESVVGQTGEEMSIKLAAVHEIPAEENLQTSSTEDSVVRTERFVHSTTGGEEVEVMYVDNDENNVLVEVPDDTSASQVHYIITYEN